MSEIPFEAPWHAQAFALTHHLADRDMFTWSDWTDALAVEIAAREIVSADDYYTAWLAALETLIDAPAELAQLKSAWKAAYLDTPHGQPVTLPSSLSKYPGGRPQHATGPSGEADEGLAPRSDRR